ncbi:MAG: TonB C-terminal domain-containing protein, partial [Candidatus Obscuribacterales bacterium]|nr:TonB C-terminal domain-containing protein [Candidatus Obscuribacterales bacterium]
YLVNLESRIKNAWFPPKNDVTKRLTAIFKIHKNGKMTDLRLATSSGDQVVDKACLAAVEKAAPFRPLPDGAPKDVDIKFSFDYNVPKGGKIVEAVSSKEKIADKAGEIEKAKSEKADNVDFGSAKLSTYTFSDGRFQIKLPGKPNASARQMQGLRFAQYKYRESQGSYNIGYTVMPSQIPVSSQNKVVSDLIRNLASVTKGTAGPVMSLPWQGYPGRQVDVQKMSGDGFKNTRLRVILVRRYLYVIQAIGTDAWLKSPVVKNVLDSLVIRPELTSDEQAQLSRQEDSRRARSHASSSFRRSQNSQSSHSRYNKEYERINADRQFRRR